MEIQKGVPVNVCDWTNTPVAVDHVVPTMGFLVEDSTAAVLLFAGDTGPTETIWNVANLTPRLRGVFLEGAFPNSKQWLADLAKHLTPQTFQTELEKLQRQVRILAGTSRQPPGTRR